jgi:hypothetical protein
MVLKSREASCFALPRSGASSSSSSDECFDSASDQSGSEGRRWPVLCVVSGAVGCCMAFWKGLVDSFGGDVGTSLDAAAAGLVALP